jgi:hypothetical protein
LDTVINKAHDEPCSCRLLKARYEASFGEQLRAGAVRHDRLVRGIDDYETDEIPNARYDINPSLDRVQRESRCICASEISRCRKRENVGWKPVAKCRFSVEYGNGAALQPRHARWRSSQGTAKTEGKTHDDSDQCGRYEKES